MPGKRLAFLYASCGSQVIALLEQDRDCARTIAAMGEAEKSVTAVMEAFLKLSCLQQPEKNPAMAGWVIRQYLTHLHNGKPVLAEDLYKIREDLAYFEALKNSGVLREASHDLQAYTLQSLRETIEPYRQKKVEREAAQTLRRMTPEEKAGLFAETTIVYDGPEGKVVIPHTPKASIHWGSNTKWCISGKEYAEKHFPSYNAKSPCIFLIPAGGDSDKIALVDYTFYNAQDKIVETLPGAHEQLWQACLENLPPQAQQSLSAWLPGNGPSEEEERQARPPLPDNIPPQWREALEYAQRCDWDKIAPGLLRSREFILAAIVKNNWVLNHAAPELRADGAFVVSVVAQDIWVLQSVLPELKEDPWFIQSCLGAVVNLAFNTASLETLKIHVPDERTLLAIRIGHLEKFLAAGETGKARKLLHQFRPLWGRSELIFGEQQETLAIIKESAVFRGRQTTCRTNASVAACPA